MSSVDIDLPPPAIDEGSSGGSAWVELTRAPDDITAHLLMGRLSEAGIETMLQKDRKSGDAWLFAGSNPWSPVALFVRMFQLTDARVVLAEIAFEAPAEDPRATRTDRSAGWRNAIVWWILALTLGAGLTQVALALTPGSMDRCDLPLLCGRP